jgi:hypothetical protein
MLDVVYYMASITYNQLQHRHCDHKRSYVLPIRKMCKN